MRPIYDLREGRRINKPAIAVRSSKTEEGSGMAIIHPPLSSAIEDGVEVLQPGERSPSNPEK
jgi:hypothetical protein